MDGTMSVADAMALRNDGGFGMNGNGDFLLLVLFLFMFGQNGFGQNGFGGAATAAAQNEILLGQRFGSVEDKLNDLGKGICDSTYALQGQIAQCLKKSLKVIKGFGTYRAVGTCVA